MGTLLCPVCPRLLLSDWLGERENFTISQLIELKHPSEENSKEEMTEMKRGVLFFLPVNITQSLPRMVVNETLSERLTSHNL